MAGDESKKERVNEMKKGQKIEGIYCGESFSGTIARIDPNWEIGSRNAVNLYVDLDTPIEMKQHGKVYDTRDSIALTGINPTTGRNYSKRGYELTKVFV